MIPYIPGGEEGFASGLNQSLDEQRQNKLKMALVNNQIESEQKAAMAEASQKAKLNTISGEQLGGLASFLRSGSKDTSTLSSLFPNGAPDSVTQSLMGAEGAGLRAQAMMDKPVHFATKPDPNNLIQNGFMSPTTGNWVGSPQTTLDPSAQKEIQKVNMQVANAHNMIQGISQRAQSILADAPQGVPIQKLNTWWQDHGMPTNPELKAFSDSLGSLSAQYIKDTTGMAPRSIELMHLDMGAFPNTTDDVKTAVQKATILDQTMQNKASTAYTNYDPTNFLKSPNHPLAVGANQNKNQLMPNTGGYGTDDFAREDLRRQSMSSGNKGK